VSSNSPEAIKLIINALVDLETLLKFIRTTKTTGLRVKAALMTGHYHKGIKPDPEDMACLDLMLHTSLPEWNYTRPAHAENVNLFLRGS
jgi:hypothetical protein